MAERIVERLHEVYEGGLEQEDIEQVLDQIRSRMEVDFVSQIEKRTESYRERDRAERDCFGRWLAEILGL